MNGCIFLISYRKQLLHTCLKCLNQNFNFRHLYPIYILYHGNIYDDENFRLNIYNIDRNVKFTFVKVPCKTPDNIEEKDMFYNLQDNQYAKQFGKNRIGYLHANYVWNNFMNMAIFDKYDYVMRIDDDSWFKKKIDIDFFSVLERKSYFFGSGFTWNNFNTNHLETRYNLFSWIQKYVNENGYIVKNEQLHKSLNLECNNEYFHKLKWSCGNLNVYNMKLFRTDEWKKYNKGFNDIGGGYKYRWGDIEVIGLYCYIHFENALYDFNLTKGDLYSPQLPKTYKIKSSNYPIT